MSLSNQQTPHEPKEERPARHGAPRGTGDSSARWFDLNNIGLVLVLWDIFLGIPASIILAKTNKAVFTWMGYEKLMRCPGGILANRCLFVAVNMILVISWAVQLVREERLYWLEREIRMWDRQIEWLEAEMTAAYGLEASEIEDQLLSGVVESGEQEEEDMMKSIEVDDIPEHASTPGRKQVFGATR